MQRCHFLYLLLQALQSELEAKDQLNRDLQMQLQSLARSDSPSAASLDSVTTVHADALTELVRVASRWIKV